MGKDGKCTVCGYDKNNNKPTTPDNPENPEQPTVTLGDVDNNGKVDTQDARMALRASIGLEKYAAGSKEFLAADVNKDNKLGTDDARYILRHSIGLKDPNIAWPAA
jgi:hypothetical protein